MPLDTSILLGAKPIETPDPMQMAVRGMTLGNLASEANMRNMQMQNLTRQQAAQDAANRVLPMVMQGNWSPDAIQAAIQREPQSASLLLDALQKKREADAKTGLDVAHAADFAAKAKAEVLKPIANQAFQLSNKPDLSPADIQQWSSKVSSNGLENLLQTVRFQDWTNPDIARKGLATAGSALFEASQQASEAEKKRQFGMEFPEKQAQNQAQRQRWQAESNIGYGNLALKKLEVDPFGMLANAAKAGPAGQAQMAEAHGDAFLQTLPQPMADQVKALAEGRMAFPAGFALKSPYWQNMISMVSKYDPNFDAINYNARSKTRSDFTSGKNSQSLNALNTVMGHLDDLTTAAGALNNTDFPILNRAENYLGGQVSPDLKGRINAFNVARNAVASELERAYRGTGGNLADIEAWKNTIDSADSPQAVQAAVKQALNLLNSKIDALGDTYSKGMGTTSQGLTLLSPKAQSTYDRLANGKTSAPKTQTQKVQSLPDPTTLPDGATVTDDATGRVLTVRGGKYQ